MTETEFKSLEPGDIVIGNQEGYANFPAGMEFIVKRIILPYTILTESDATGSTTNGWHYDFFDLPTTPFKPVILYTLPSKGA